MEAPSELEKALWQLIQVKDEIKSDKETSLNALKEVMGSLDKTTKRFSAHLQELEHIVEQAPHMLGEQLSAATEQAAHQIVKHIHHSVDDKLTVILSGLKSSTYQAQQALENTKRSLTRRTILMTACFCSGSLISALLIVWFVIQRPSTALTPDMAKTYQLGLILKNTFSKLSIKEQGYIKKLLKL